MKTKNVDAMDIEKGTVVVLGDQEWTVVNMSPDLPKKKRHGDTYLTFDLERVLGGETEHLTYGTHGDVSMIIALDNS